MTTDAGSQELRVLAERLVADIGSLQAQLVHHDDTSHMQHMEFCDRAADFAAYVDSALLLSERRRFAQALSLLRSALDHWAADLVSLLGDRFVQLYSEATEAMLADAVRRREAGELERVVEEPRLVGKNNFEATDRLARSDLERRRSGAASPLLRGTELRPVLREPGRPTPVR